MRRTIPLCLLALLLSAQAAAAQTQPGRILGTVSEAETARPLEGVTVAVGGTSLTSVTGANGQFVIPNVPPGTYTVRLMHLAYETREESVTVRSNEMATVRVTLAPQPLALAEIVAVGYGAQRRSDLTGAVASVNMAAVERMPVVSIDQMLQGMAPGVQVTQASSAPGGGISIRIRGGTSISESVSNEPLYVIDGFPVEIDYDADNSRLAGGRSAGITVPTNPLTSLNPRDIESIEILKDASATAIYGSRAANGVVLITTKQGQASAPRVNFEAYSGVQSVAKRYDLLNGPEYAAFANEWAASQDMEPIFTNPASMPTTDWQSEIFRNAPLQSYQLSLTGGSTGPNATRYAISGGYFNQDGVVIGSAFERMSVRLNLRQDIRSRFRLGTTLTGSRVTTNFATTDGAVGGADASAVAAALQSIPTLAVRRADGSFTTMAEDAPVDIRAGDVQNPVAVLTSMLDELGDTRFLSNTFGEVELMSGLRFRSSLGANVVHRKRDTYWPRETLRGRQAQGQAVRGRNESLSLLNENTLSLNRSFGADHTLNAVVGYTRQKQDASSTSMTNEVFLSDLLNYFDIGSGNRPGGPLVSSGAARTTLASYLGRANYTLMNRYMFTFTSRYDGSSRFGPQRKWAYFPSGAVAWRVSEESFMRDVPLLNDLKLRASYGATGNSGVSAYQSLPTMSPRDASFGDNIVTGYRQTRLGNEELGWETTHQLDLGMDVGFLNNLVTMTADYYHRKTTDLLLQVQLPMETGFREAFQNAGAVRNEGLELSLGINPLRGDGLTGLRWSNNLNFSRNRNMVLDLGPVDILRVRGISANFNFPGTDIRVGYPIGVFFGYKTNGLFRDSAQAANYAATLPNRRFQAGEAVVLDLSGPDGIPDGIINEFDRTVIGDPNPKFNLGWNTSIGWRGLEVTSLLYGAFGADVLNLNLVRVEGGTPQTNVTRNRFTDRWTPENPDAKYPRIGTTSGVIGSNYVDTMLEDGSFVRLSNVSLSWGLPSRWVSARGFQEARLFVTGNNLYTWTKYSGFNPEVSSMGVGNVNRGVDVGAYPLARSFTFGVSIGY